MNKAMFTPPKTYQEWLACFAYFKKNKISKEHIIILSKGSLQCNHQIIAKLETHIINLLNEMIDIRTKGFIKQLQMSLESNDIDEITLLFKKYCNDIKLCLFYEKMEFMPVGFKHELSSVIQKQTSEFLQSVLKHLARQAEESNNDELENVLFQIRRIKFS